MRVILFCFSLLTISIACTPIMASESLNDDLLEPYPVHHFPTHSSRSVRDTHPSLHNNPFVTYEAHVSERFLPVADTRYFVSDIALNSWGYSSNHVYGHITKVSNPLRTWSVYETAQSGCSDNKLDTVVNAARKKNCFVAQNGGYFNTKTKSCLGNVISDGVLLHNTTATNAHFGILKNGTIVVGYLSESDLQTLDFQNLVGGVIWLVRNGSSFVEESISVETSKTEETGSLRYFSNVQSARTAIGHDREGRVVLVQVDGQTGVRGANLNGFAKFLIEELHLVNAINLDGGGSATIVINGTLANTPSDHCKEDRMYRCPRAVSTMVCAHSSHCDRCDNGVCENGRCKCNNNWVGVSCDRLQCGRHNCSGHGTCLESGCMCDAGWQGEDCFLPCNSSTFGRNCAQRCRCSNNGLCDATNGICDCQPGFYGRLCDQECPAWKYGKNCQFNCHCSATCFCDSVTGQCGTGNSSRRMHQFQQLETCIKSSTHEKEDSLIYDGWSNDELYRQLIIAICAIFSLLMLSMIVNFVLLLRRSTAIKRYKYDTIDSDGVDLSSSASEQPTNNTSKFRQMVKIPNIFSNGYEKLNNTDSGEFHELSLLSPT